MNRQKRRSSRSRTVIAMLAATAVGPAVTDLVAPIHAQTTLSASKRPLAPEIEERARSISKELRCVVCQNQSIDESNAPLALDLKQLLRERLQAGESDAEAKAFLVARYGNFVLLKPPLQLNTLMLWIGPFLLLGVALLVVWRYLTTPLPAGEGEVELSTDELSRADLMLGKEHGV